MNYSKKQILAITRSKNYTCSETSSYLNYPSLIAFYNNTRSFERTVINLGDGMVNYNVTVSAPKGAVVQCHRRDWCSIRSMRSKTHYTMTSKYKSNKKHGEHFGALAWVDDNGKYSVRSPIVITCFNC